MPIRTLLVDDENHARQALRHLLKQHPEIEVIEECANGKLAVKAIHELSPDAVFLDIHMPKLDGFEVLELVGQESPLVVFITAHDEYAIQAFENNALDYILKPVSAQRLATTVERLVERVAQRQQDVVASQQSQDQHVSELVDQHREQQGSMSRLLIREKGDVYVVPTCDIVAIEAADDYVVVQTSETSYVKQERMSRLEKALDASQFCRIHRSTLVNVDFLLGIETEGKETRFANMRCGEQTKQYAISRSGYSRLVNLL